MPTAKMPGFCINNNPAAAANSAAVAFVLLVSFCSKFFILVPTMPNWGLLM